MATDEENARNESWTLNKRWNRWNRCTKLTQYTSQTEVPIAHSIRASMVSISMVIDSTITQCYFLQLFLKNLTGEYHKYPFILLHSCDYLNEILIKVSFATKKGNGQKET